MSLLGADRLWKFKQDMPLDADGLDPIKYQNTNVMYGTAITITIDYSWYKELRRMGLLINV